MGNPVPDISMNIFVNLRKNRVISSLLLSGVLFHFGSDELVALAVDVYNLD